MGWRSWVGSIALGLGLSVAVVHGVRPLLLRSARAAIGGEGSSVSTATVPPGLHGAISEPRVMQWNGVPMAYQATEFDEPAAAVVEAFERAHASHVRPFVELTDRLADVEPYYALHAWQLAAAANLPLGQVEGPHGLVMLDPPAGGLSNERFARGLEAWNRSGDLSGLVRGKVLLAFDRAPGRGSVGWILHVGEGLERAMPRDVGALGPDTPGADLEGVPRPRDARRVVSLDDTRGGTGFAQVHYVTRAAAPDAVHGLDAALAERGFAPCSVPAPASAEMPAFCRIRAGREVHGRALGREGGGADLLVVLRLGARS